MYYGCVSLVGELGKLLRRQEKCVFLYLLLFHAISFYDYRPNAVPNITVDFFLDDVHYKQYYIRNFKAFKKFSVEFENVKHDVNKTTILSSKVIWRSFWSNWSPLVPFL
jgi:hypothetical protein